MALASGTTLGPDASSREIGEGPSTRATGLPWH